MSGVIGEKNFEHISKVIKMTIDTKAIEVYFFF